MDKTLTSRHDTEIIDFAKKHYGKPMSESVREALRAGGQFAEHVRRSYLREMQAFEDDAA